MATAEGLSAEYQRSINEGPTNTDCPWNGQSRLVTANDGGKVGPGKSRPDWQLSRTTESPEEQRLPAGPPVGAVLHSGQ